ncbi:U3 small nucleolar RNA-associated protein 6 homolog [Arctopsyche grandis]|uniref:U3 small nucleolar RNA-associated protein 6 homolog n=1 Tax=Arctopsyche grandis TaxID=121162 RepID=UPI00406D93E9
MAEFVNQRIEDMLNELEQMKRIGLYTDEEIKMISKRRKDFEYKIHRRVRCKEDFLKYVGYECVLLQNIKLRREQNKISDKKNDIEYTISKRVIKLFKELITRFPNDLEIWLNFMEFCKSVQNTYVITGYLEKLTQIHGDKAKVWQLAGRWEYEEMNSLDSGRTYIMKGIQRHVDSQDLHIDLLRIELLMAEAMTEDDLVTQMTRINLVVDFALKNVQSVDFIIKMCTIVNDFSFATDVRTKLFTILWEKYCDDSDAWNFIADCELKNKDVGGFDWLSLNSNAFTSHYPSNLESFVNVHETAISKVPTRKSVLNYINSAIKLIANTEFGMATKLNTMNRAFTTGHTLKLLNEQYYKLWLDILCSDSVTGRDKILNILEEACQNIPSSEFIWLERLKRCTNNSNDMMILFKKAKLAVPTEKVASLWEYVITSTKDITTLKKLYQESMMLPPKMASTVKPLLLKSYHENSGIDFARSEYKSMAITTPFVIELHNAMIEIEKCEKVPNAKHLRLCYNLAIQQFGSKDVDVWLRCVEFEIQAGHPEACGALYSRACSNLNDSVVSTFMSKYSEVINRN